MATVEQHRFFRVDSEVELLLTVTKFTKMGSKNGSIKALFVEHTQSNDKLLNSISLGSPLHNGNSVSWSCLLVSNGYTLLLTIAHCDNVDKKLLHNWFLVIIIGFPVHLLLL